MPQDALVIPPIRQSLEDTNSAAANGNAQPLTEKSWYLYWSRLGEMANRQNWMVNVGTHADRPPADAMPQGAIYVEFDRGAIYQNWTGAWQYLAGTMYGTLAPDKRPTDLGSHDAGFDYRTTDQPPREFIWSGTAWVEVTAVTVGTHANRPAAASEAEGNLYVEYDRGAIYQNWVGGWEYLAGTMWGTLVPDQRPTGLGSRDAGFDFRTTDAPPREFIWSGTAWIEIGAEYLVNGTLIGTRPALNLIAGSNVTISGSDNPGSDRVDVTVSSSGGGTGGTVTSVFSRTGAVAAQAGDYTAAQVTNAANTASSYADPSWITSLSWSKITGAPATGVSSFNTRTGAVVPATGDYTAAQVTNAVSTTGSYPNPTWITSLAVSKVTGAVSDGGLTHANVVTKVGTAGQIVEGGITDQSAGNSGSMVITNSGNVGIGASSPAYRLDVRTPGSTAGQVHIASTNTDAGCYLNSEADANAILSAGVVFNGTAWVAKATTASLFNQANGILAFNTDSSLTVGSTYTPTERMRIAASGNVGIGTSNPGTKLHIAAGTAGASLYVGTSASGGNPGDICMAREAAASNGAIFFGNAGAYIFYNGTSFVFNPATSNLPSDARLKQNVRDLTGGIDVINQIRPIEAEWNGLGDTKKGQRLVSILAQELEKVLPGAVNTYRTPEGDEFLSYNPEEIMLQAVLAIQQLSRRLEALELAKKIA